MGFYQDLENNYKLTKKYFEGQYTISDNSNGTAHNVTFNENNSNGFMQIIELPRKTVIVSSYGDMVLNRDNGRYGFNFVIHQNTNYGYFFEKVNTPRLEYVQKFSSEYALEELAGLYETEEDFNTEEIDVFINDIESDMSYDEHFSWGNFY